MKISLRILLLTMLFAHFDAISSYTPHEMRFYKAQANFIKGNWKKIIRNESAQMIETKHFVQTGSSLPALIKKIKNCSSIDICKNDLIKLTERLQKIENESLTILSSLAALELSVIEKNPTKYTLFIKHITDINHVLSESRLLINQINISSKMISPVESKVEEGLTDLISITENLSFQIKTLPQVLINDDVKTILTLGESEFVNHLESSITDLPISRFHELDKVFNVMNRDLQKNKTLISSNSRNVLLQIHQRWNAILKIVKRK